MGKAGRGKTRNAYRILKGISHKIFRLGNVSWNYRITLKLIYGEERCIGKTIIKSTAGFCKQGAAE
jgi:hypothetical protein